MNRLIALVIALLVSNCATGENITKIDPGMTSDQVIQVMGKPDGFQRRGEYTIIKYTNRLISGWSWDRTDYTFIFKSNKLVEYGAGEVRERNVGGLHSFFLYQL